MTVPSQIGNGGKNYHSRLAPAPLKSILVAPFSKTAESPQVRQHTVYLLIRARWMVPAESTRMVREAHSVTRRGRIVEILLTASVGN